MATITKKKQREPEVDLSSLLPHVEYDENEDAPFERAYILPIRTQTIEKSLSPRGQEVEDVLHGKVVGQIIITLPKTRIGEGGKAMLIDTPYSIPIPGRTDDNEAIRDRQPLREINRALYFGEGNGKMYRLAPITKEQLQAERQMRKDRELAAAKRTADQRASGAGDDPVAQGMRDRLPNGQDSRDEMLAEAALKSVMA